MNRLMKYFEYRHLPDKLKLASKPFCDLAKYVDDNFVESPEKSAGMRKLLEAKDCIVRAALDNVK